MHVGTIPSTSAFLSYATDVTLPRKSFYGDVTDPRLSLFGLKNKFLEFFSDRKCCQFHPGKY